MIAVIERTEADAPTRPKEEQERDGYMRPKLPPGTRRGTVREFVQYAAEKGLRVIDGGVA